MSDGIAAWPQTDATLVRGGSRWADRRYVILSSFAGGVFADGWHGRGTGAPVATSDLEAGAGTVNYATDAPSGDRRITWGPSGSNKGMWITAAPFYSPFRYLATGFVGDDAQEVLIYSWVATVDATPFPVGGFWMIGLFPYAQSFAGYPFVNAPTAARHASFLFDNNGCRFAYRNTGALIVTPALGVINAYARLEMRLYRATSTRNALCEAYVNDQLVASFDWADANAPRLAAATDYMNLGMIGSGIAGGPTLFLRDGVLILGPDQDGTP